MHGWRHKTAVTVGYTVCTRLYGSAVAAAAGSFVVVNDEYTRYHID